MIVNTLIAFALTLILTKSKVLGGKREFVEQRYEAAKVNNEQPGWIHCWWHAIWTCPMCAGFWVAIPISLCYPVRNLFTDVLVIFGLNWLMHCMENLLFFAGEMFRNIDDEGFIEESTKAAKKIEKYYDRVEHDLWESRS